ncbi:hypothetical protein PUMCH_004127 [Australozyma saopauloensis]|uniref:Uncharacterized protein n=1 Tax=Australozyma saopauloensis TaxID=291208 RepID=A0AAX4HEH2_9ASCO|nr:hypothetical protein PUMCH_004127 [[Candida] saopauloensis]
MNIGSGTSPRDTPDARGVASSAYIGGSQDIPPDMALLLQKLEEDFTVNKSIDQWTYINRREEIMREVARIHQQQQTDVALDPAQLEKILLPRKRTDIATLTKLSLVSIMRERAEMNGPEPIFTVLDAKGKVIQSLLWEKLFLKAVKVAHELKHRVHFKTSDIVVLLYKEHEVCDFAVALFACYIANVTAIPVHNDISLIEMFDILQLTNSLLVLLSESVSRELEKLSTASLTVQWPSKVTKLRTSDLGSARNSEIDNLFGKNKKKTPESKNDLAYIEFSRSPVGELRGIPLSHRTILHQMNSLDISLLSSPESGGSIKDFGTSIRKAKRVFLSTMDIRTSIGLIMGIMFTIYSGNMLVWAPPKVMEVQGLYANIVTKCRANLLLADFIGLKRVTYDYQQSPNATRYFSKAQRVDFSTIKWVLINALTVDGDFIEVLTERFLKPLGCQQARNVIVPLLTLSDYGGMVISMRDWIGKAENMGIELEGKPTDDISSVMIDKEALTQNLVRVIDSNPFEPDEHDQEALRVDAFGYPLPDAALAVVNPELSTVARKGELGEIWVDSPCLSGGFYGLKKESKLIFHAKCRNADGLLEMDFLRTGLLGFTWNGKVYVLGLYEDRIRQRYSWIDQKFKKSKKKIASNESGMRYHYSSHLLATLATEVRQVYDCTIFDIFIGNEYLPVAIVEAEIVRKLLDDIEPTNSNGLKSKDKYDYTVAPLNEPVLNAIAKKCFDTLNSRHQLRLFCVMVVDIDVLPKIMRSGGMEIANMLCKKRFLEGSLQSEFVKFFIRQSISMIPHGEDVIGGIWSPFASELRSSSLVGFPEQRSIYEPMDKMKDDRTEALLSDFKTIIDLLKFRVATSGDLVAFQNIEGGGKARPLTWRKFENRVHAVCQYFIDKTSIKPGQYIILMYSLSEEFIIALFACFMCGFIPIPMLPFDTNRIGEDFPAFVGIVKDFDVKEVLVNDDVERYMKMAPVSDSIKRMNQRRPTPIRFKNTSKITKVSNVASLNSKLSKYQAAANFRDENTVCLVWLNFTSDHYRVAANLSHKNLMNICKIFKVTCKLSHKSSVVGCVRHSAGIGFVQAALLGVYLGTSTFLCSPVAFAESPLTFFQYLQKYRVKDVFMTEQMLKYAVAKFTPRGLDLSCLRNMMISTENRVEVDLLKKIAKIFQPARISVALMSAVYTHFFNPIISTRSYMKVAPVDLFLDPLALRQGYISIVNQADYPNALRVQDSGMIPVCSQIAIVNPETCKICKEGEFGEIWVSSEANLLSFTNGPKGPQDYFTQKQFKGIIADKDPNVTYLRTGELGFLHNISISKLTNNNDEPDVVTTFQPLFVLGKISDTFELLGLHHFPMDIESTIESCHPDIFKNGSCIFKCSDYVIVVCEAKRNKNLSSLVPLITNTVFSKHHVFVDIVAFIKKGEFPISRLGTKQRARIVDAWVQGIIPLSVQYGINYGENSMIKLIKEIDEVARDDPLVGLRNPAQSYYDAYNENYLDGCGLPLMFNASDQPYQFSQAVFEIASTHSDYP